LTGISFVMLCLSIALAYDFSRLHNVTSKVQNGLDAAGLAAAKLLENELASDGDIATVANTFFNARRPQIRMDGLTVGKLNVAVNRAASTVTLKVPGSLTSLFGGLANLAPTLDFVRENTTIYKSKKIELSLVLDITGSMANNGKIEGLRTAAQDLIDTLFAANPNPGAIKVSLVPYSASVNAGTYWSAATGKFFFPFGDTCVVERPGSNMTTDAPPSFGGYVGTSSVALNPAYVCPKPTVEPLTDLWDFTTREAFKSRIAALTPFGGTAGHIGLAWGWYTLSPNWAPFWPALQKPRPSSPDVIKAVIFMTDGDFNTSYVPPSINSLDVNATASSGNQTLDLCSAMKTGQNEIKIYSIGFQAPPGAEAMLRTCSGDSNFFDAANTSELISAFREIVERLTSLRVES
jgi:Flp pilus assembly protein TadG